MQKLKDFQENYFNFKKWNYFLGGNGGSASDSQHLAAGLLDDLKNRTPLKSISLNTDTSVMTALSNDYSYDILFQGQLQALGSKNDLLIAISTSGNSKNILNVLKEARKNIFFRLSPWKRWRRGKEIFRLKYYSPSNSAKFKKCIY